MQVACYLAKPQYTTDNAAMIAYAGLRQQAIPLDDVIVAASKKIQARELFHKMRKIKKYE
jgi:tRNA A37 threonylcarbamoyltransferase TsaD